MNRREIIDFAMKKAEVSGSDMLATCRTLLNLSLERLATEFRFPFLLRTQSFTFSPGTTTYDLPLNYVRHMSLKLTTSSGADVSTETLDPKDSDGWDRISNLGTSGKPTCFFVDRYKQAAVVDDGNEYMKLLLDKNPDKVYSATLRYFTKPAWLDPDVVSSYDAASVPYPDYLICDALVYEIFEYWNDDRADNQWKKVENRTRQFNIQEFDHAGAQSVVALDERFFS